MFINCNKTKCMTVGTKNNNGPSIEPWGTPYFTGHLSERAFPICTCFVLFIIYIQYMYMVGKYKIYSDKYETGTNVTRTMKKTPLTTFMKGEEWRLFLFFLFKSDFFDIAG
jgi:hypothetical protein